MALSGAPSTEQLEDFELEADADFEADLQSMVHPEISTGSYSTEFHRFKPEMRSRVIVERDVATSLDTRAREIIPEECHRSQNYLITDSIMDSAESNFLPDRVLCGLRCSGLQFDKIVMKADGMDETGETSAEKNKTLATFSQLADDILAKGIDKHSCIVSLGGGVVNNLCGFLAASLYRGIKLVHITTTMMGQADAAIDFKQAVNHPKGKNLLGCYYPADVILCDPSTLLTLSDRHLLNGLAECLKHALTQDAELLAFMTENTGKHLRHVKFLETVVKHTIHLKAPTLTYYDTTDLFEMCPQYGHSVGHAVEHLSWEEGRGGALLHGEGVTIGMCVSAEIAFLMGLCTAEVVEKIYSACAACLLPQFIPCSMSAEEVFKKMAYDKHFVQKKPTMGLVSEIGVMAKTTKEDGSETYGWQIESDVLLRAVAANEARRDAQ
eukprot:NODE_1153_length_1672_cov_949.829328_g1023_i0.p1 GENE.NODE_1153_length_1672_cov_949.829328_g1023_i0~~NODE_1153_length_1672_cov_949.829328_g1023_i0.p1  ORF type:complete len:497 (+),score=101.02 NODE_1153_length_1672_cov_949.829328_g1023_i0:175-1491(+)